MIISPLSQTNSEQALVMLKSDNEFAVFENQEMRLNNMQTNG
jgi:hypothetical protein